MELLELHAKDFGPLKEFTLPLHKQGLVWVGGVNRDSKAAKSNGSGKSSIFKALTWCLWGETIDKENGDKVIRSGQKEAVVTAKLEGGWKVERRRRRGSPRLQIIQPDGTPWKAAGKDAQERINELIGLDFKAFKNTVLYGQNDSSRFANPATRDADRKDMLHRIMRTEMLKHCHEYVREKAHDLKVKADFAATEVSLLRAKLDEHDVSGLQCDFDEFECDREARVKEHAKQAEAHKDTAQCEAEVASSLEGLQEKLKAADGAETGVEDEIEVCDQRLRELRKALDAAREPLHTLNAELKQLDAQLARMDGAKCPVCTSPLDAGTAGEHKQHLIEEREAVAAKGRKLRDKAAKVEESLKEAEAKRAGLAQRQREVAQAARRIAVLREEIANAKLAGERSHQFIERAKTALKAAKEAKAAANPHADRLEQAKAKAKEYKMQLAVLVEKSKEVGAELAHVEFWVRGFSGQGLPSFILDSVMPFITERSNHYLETLSDGDIQIQFDTQRELKSAKGEYRDEINVTWSIEGVDDSYPASGGQLKKMEIAADLALMDLVATREGGHIDLLMMDEVLDGLDDEGRQRVLQLLHELRGKRGSIFVISHETDVAEIFEKAVTVVKSGGESCLEISV